jgi:hypothetical protein
LIFSLTTQPNITKAKPKTETKCWQRHIYYFGSTIVVHLITGALFPLTAGITNIKLLQRIP